VRQDAVRFPLIAAICVGRHFRLMTIRPEIIDAVVLSVIVAEIALAAVKLAGASSGTAPRGPIRPAQCASLDTRDQSGRTSSGRAPQEQRRCFGDVPFDRPLTLRFPA
jgi:hypothetical protein